MDALRPPFGKGIKPVMELLNKSVKSDLICRGQESYSTGPIDVEIIRNNMRTVNVTREEYFDLLEEI